MLFKAPTKVIGGVMACLAFTANALAQRPAWVIDEWTKPASERLAAVPNLDAKLAAAKKIPILITAGGKDTISPPEGNIEAYNKVKESGFPAEMVVYPDSGQEAVFTNSAPEVFWWFETHSK